MGLSIALASPTGRAAQRLSSVTCREALTLHRLLEFDPRTMSFQRHSDNPIPAQAIVVDEASMIDLFLGHSLLMRGGYGCTVAASRRYRPIAKRGTRECVA